MTWVYLTGLSRSPEESRRTEYDLGVLTDAKEIIVAVSSQTGSLNNWIQAGFLRIVTEITGLGLVELFDVQLQLERRYIPLPQGLDVRFFYRPPEYLIDFNLTIYESDQAPILTSDQALILLGFL
jgi:hypothetical protein